VLWWRISVALDDRLFLCRRSGTVKGTIVARKNMADRYAAQRSNRTVRRRTLPRLSDGETAPRDRADSGVSVDDGMPMGRGTRVGTETVETFAPGAGASRARSASLPRMSPGATSDLRARAATGMRAGRGGLAASAVARVDYGYVRRDLRRIAITAVGMLALLIVLNILLQSVVH